MSAPNSQQVMRSLLLNTNTNKIRALKTTAELDELYRLIGCGNIDIVTRKIGERVFEIVVDDEGLAKDDAKISAVDEFNVPMLFGNLLFFRNDGNGNLIELTEDDIKCIRKHTRTIDFDDEKRTVVEVKWILNIIG